MSTSPRVEIVAALLVNYESGPDLLAALESLAALGRAPDVYIVVDNASQDNSLALACRCFLGKMAVIRNPANVGFATAVNQGLRSARKFCATHVWLFNPDARAREGALSALLRVAHEAPLALLSPLIVDATGKTWFSGGTIAWWRMRAVHQECPVLRGRVQSHQFLTGCALFLPLPLIERLGDFDERFFLYYEDTDYSVRAREAGFNLLVVTEAVVEHREVSRFNPQKTYFLVFSGLLFFWKHARGWRRPFFQIYVTIRRLKNWFDCLLWGGKEAMSVRQAYGDFFRTVRSSARVSHHRELSEPVRGRPPVATPSESLFSGRRGNHRQ